MSNTEARTLLVDSISILVNELEIVELKAREQQSIIDATQLLLKQLTDPSVKETKDHLTASQKEANSLLATLKSEISEKNKDIEKLEQQLKSLSSPPPAREVGTAFTVGPDLRLTLNPLPVVDAERTKNSKLFQVIKPGAPTPEVALNLWTEVYQAVHIESIGTKETLAFFVLLSKNSEWNVVFGKARPKRGRDWNE
jgi:hypothetical protein